MNSKRLMQIYEDDLADLERMVPDIMLSLMPHLATRQKVQLRRIKDILSNVRWNYCPPLQVEVIDASPDDLPDDHHKPEVDDEGQSA